MDYNTEVCRALVSQYGWAMEDALAWTAQRSGIVSAFIASGGTPLACAWRLRAERAERFISDMGDGEDDG